MNLNAKCSDMFGAHLVNSKSEGIVGESYNGYVPEWMPGQHYGDYVELTIDAKTGKIENWMFPSSADLMDTFGGVGDILHISARCKDLCWAGLDDDLGNRIGEYDGYALPCVSHPDMGGDYVGLVIEIATGQIIDWKAPTKAELKRDFKLGKKN